MNPYEEAMAHQNIMNQDSTVDPVEPVFEYKSSKMNLTYEKFIPFILAYIAYKLLWKM
jgi:hypothetical protein